MTLLVGIVADNGVVLATDRQVTHGAMGATTVGQAGTKVTLLRNQGLYASSGAVGLGQQIAAVVTERERRFHAQTSAAAVSDIQGDIRKILGPAFEMAQKAVPVIGHQAAQQDALCAGLLAGRFSDGIQLIDIGVTGGCEILTTKAVPFVCQGSGKANADPILRYLWNIFWNAAVPTLREAVLAGFWTVKVVTDLRTQSVGCGVEVFTLSKDGKEGKGALAQQIPEDALAEHGDFITSVEAAMRGVRDQMIGKSADGTPPPPTVPTA